jgi:hypothetical protein
LPGTDDDGDLSCKAHDLFPSRFGAKDGAAAAPGASGATANGLLAAGAAVRTGMPSADAGHSMMKPLCFVLMPFGRKPNDQGRIIDFDAVYQDVIAPAVDQANFEGIRADEERVGGTIHKPMFERLMLCEYAIADLTIANPNVYYELGIRHAMRPRSTVLLNASGTRLPFDLALVRAIPYNLDDEGKPATAHDDARQIAAQLGALSGVSGPDSPVFQLVEGLTAVNIAHEKTDIFRERAAYSNEVKSRLKTAREQGGKAALTALDKIADNPALRQLADVDAGIVVDLLLSYRAVDGYQQMVDLYRHVAPELQRAPIMQEQYAFALNRLGRGTEAERVLLTLIEQRGASGETNGLLGRIYKDRWQQARDAKEGIRAAGELKRAIDAYSAGFDADWRDAFPGINAVTLMEMQDKPDPRQKDMLPVVRYAALHRARRTNADYWDHATMLELAVLGSDQSDAVEWLQNAVASLREAWEAESTKRNLGLIRQRREQRGEDGAWIGEVEGELQKAADRIRAGG